MIAIISISKQGNQLAARLSELLGDTVCYTHAKWQTDDFSYIKGSIKEFCGVLFQQYDALIFIMASGIVVRSIAPWLKDKTTDPAVVVMDDKGENVISLLSGHLGGANALTQKIAQLIHAHPVITTASDVHHLPSVDMLAKSKGLVIDSMIDAKTITAMIVNKEKVELQDEAGVCNADILPKIEGPTRGKIIVSNKAHIHQQLPFVRLIPKNIVLGVGCKKHTEPILLMKFIHETMARFNLDLRSVDSVCSIDIKSQEEAILQAAKQIKCSLTFYSKEQLQQVDHLFQGSEFVRTTVGVASVSATSAYLTGKGEGRFWVKKAVAKGITLSIFERKIKV